jgi:aminoglycoside phosphotransferase (APT) family kinase protein
MPDTASPVNLDRSALSLWLARLPGFEAARIAGIAPLAEGASNLTYRVALEGARLAAVALRLEREAGIFAPYDVIREGEVLRRLATSPVPVPEVMGSEPDPAVLGAPFLVMEWVDAPHMGVAGPEVSFDAYVEMVARVHALDWRALGLDFLGVPGSPAEASLLELDRIAARMAAFGCDGEPLLCRALDVLRATVPGDGRLALCQGDINVFNYLFRGGRVAAVVDWEQAHIGDPRSDVGHLLALALLKGAPFGDADQMPFARAYALALGEPLQGMGYFRARWLFELGVIYHGWVAFNDSPPWYSWEHVSALLERAISY